MDEDKNPALEIELFGELGAILSLCDNDMAQNAKTRKFDEGVWQETMLAGKDTAKGLN